MPGVGRSVDRDRTRGAVGMLASKASNPVGERGDSHVLGGSRHRRREPDEVVRGGVAASEPGPAPADRDLELQHRLEPVQVWAIQGSDLDQAHGPARIATGNGHTSSMTTSTAAGHAVTAAELAELRATVKAGLPAFLADLERMCNIDCGSYTPAGVNQIADLVDAELAFLGA